MLYSGYFTIDWDSSSNALKNYLVINNTEGNGFRNKEKASENDNDEYNFTDIHTSWLFHTSCDDTDHNSDHSK